MTSKGRFPKAVVYDLVATAEVVLSFVDDCTLRVEAFRTRGRRGVYRIRCFRLDLFNLTTLSGQGHSAGVWNDYDSVFARSMLEVRAKSAAAAIAAAVAQLELAAARVVRVESPRSRKARRQGGA